MDIKKVLRESAEGLGFRYNEENTLAVGEKKRLFLYCISCICKQI